MQKGEIGENMNYKAIIFDMDGTIVSTENIWKEAGKRLIERRGITYTDELHCEIGPRVQGLASHKSCKIIKDIAQLPEPLEQLIEEKIGIAHELYLEGIEFIDGFLEFHQKIVTHNIKNAIATNACDKTILLTNNALNIQKLFGEHIYGIASVNYVCKPDPAIYLYAAQKLGVDPKDCIAFEDSAHGINAAVAAGMYCIGITTARCPVQVCNAHRTFDSYRELDLLKLKT